MGGQPRLAAWRPPETACGCLAEQGRTYLAYARGLTEPIRLQLMPADAGLKARQWNPRNGVFSPVEFKPESARFSYRPSDRQDWLVVLD